MNDPVDADMPPSVDGCFLLWGDVCDPRAPNVALPYVFFNFYLLIKQLLRAYFVLDPGLDVEKQRLIM